MAFCFSFSVLWSASLSLTQLREKQLTVFQVPGAHDRKLVREENGGGVRAREYPEDLDRRTTEGYNLKYLSYSPRQTVICQGSVDKLLIIFRVQYGEGLAVLQYPNFFPIHASVEEQILFRQGWHDV